MTVLFLYADNAILLPPNEASVSGKPAIRKRYEALFARTRTAARFEVDEERAAGPYGYIRGRMIGQRTASDGLERVANADESGLSDLRALFRVYAD